MADDVRCIVIITDTGAATVHQLASVIADRCARGNSGSARSSLITLLNSTQPPVVVATDLREQTALKLGAHLEELGAMVDVREQQGLVQLGPFRC